MDFLSFQEAIRAAQCPRWNERQRRLHALTLIRQRKQYEILDLADFENARESNAFSGASDGYVPLAKRRPATRYDIVKTIIRDQVSMLFSEAKFPVVVFENDADTEAAKEVIKAADLREVMPLAATKGSAGSVVIVPEVFPGDDGGVLYVDLWDSYECNPFFKRTDPKKLEHVDRTWRVERESLVADGYDVDELDRYWKEKAIRAGWLDEPLPNQPNVPLFQKWYIKREITENDSVWYWPVPERIYHLPKWDAWEKDDDRSVHHGLGFCPAIFVRNPGEGDVDGECSFEGAVDNQFFIDRLMSVGGQAIIGAGMPILATSTGGQGNSTFGLDGVGGSAFGNAGGNAVSPDSVLEVAERNGAWLVQMSADGTTALDMYARLLVSQTKDNCGGSRVSEENTTGKESGYAMELLNQALVWVVDQLRVAYGEPALIALIRMVAKLNAKFPVASLKGVTFNPDAKLKEISWGDYYQPSGQDLQFKVQAVSAALEAGLIQQETAVAAVANDFDVTDIQEEVAAAKSESEEKQKAELDGQIQLVKAKPAPAVGAK